MSGGPILVIQNDDVRQILSLGNQDYTIGRDPDSDIVIPSQFVSRTHAILMTLEDDRWIVDRGSANGLTVSGKTVQRHRLVDGDEVILGPLCSITYYEDSTSFDPDSGSLVPVQPHPKDPDVEAI